MSYEIPQQLQHKEKIVFGLTFTQLAWALLFGAITLMILTGKGGITKKFILALFPATFGVLFVFFDVSTQVKRLWYFFKFREASLESAKMQSFIEISRVEDNVIYSHVDVAIMQVIPMNFSIKNTSEQEGIIFGFQRFLNSLDFPVQFIVTTHNLDMSSYLKSLEKNATNKELYDDFKIFLKNNIIKNQMRNRYFYLIIPKKSDLNIQCQVAKERLESIGLKVRRIRDEQILKDLYSFFNDIKDVRDKDRTYFIKKTVPTTIKEWVNAIILLHNKKVIESRLIIADNYPYIEDIIWILEEEVEDSVSKTSSAVYLTGPNILKDNVDYIIRNKKYCRIIAAIGYPRMVESGFLDKIISSNEDFDISIHIEPYSIETTMIMLNKELEKQRADLYAEELKKSINPSLEIKYNDTRKVLEELQKGTEKLFNVSLYINCKAKTKQELDLLTKKVEAELNSMMIVPSVPIFRQIPAYKSMIPIAKDELKIKRNITTRALSAFYPFTSPFLTVESDGIMLGLNKNKVPYIKNIFGLSNANGIILATSGAGKSYFTKLLIARQLLNNTKVIVIDPQSEYPGLVSQCKGEMVTISRTSKTIINPLDLMDHDFIEKRLALMDLFQIMFGELSEIQKAILDKAVNETYAKKDITADSYKDIKPPILSDLYAELSEMDAKASPMEKSTYRALLNRLYMYTDGVFQFLNKESKIDFKKDFVCFNIGDMPKQVKPVIMFLILDYVYMKMKQSKEKKLLVIDEAWSLLSHTEEAGYIFEIVKTCRKYNMGLLLITQDVADLVNSKAGNAILANSSYSMLLRQKPAVIDSVVKKFNLSPMERGYLLTATQGKGILILDNEHQELEVIASPKEHKIITTNPNEKKTEINTEDDRIAIQINLDLNKKLYYGKDLNPAQKNYLGNHGYAVANFTPIGKPRQEECWIKTNKTESVEHTFLVQNIKQELERFTKDIEINIAEKPDILFKNKNGEEFALEIETGINFDQRKKYLAEKFHKVKLKYKKNAVIILTTNKVKYKYEKINNNIPIMLRADVKSYIDSLFKR